MLVLDSNEMFIISLCQLLIITACMWRIYCQYLMMTMLDNSSVLCTAEYSVVLFGFGYIVGSALNLGHRTNGCGV